MKTTLDVWDLWDIRAIAQRYLKEGIYISNRRAVYEATKAVKKMRRYFIRK